MLSDLMKKIFKKWRLQSLYLKKLKKLKRILRKEVRKMELFKTTEENIDKLVRKGLNSKSWIYHPEQFTEFSGICSEDLIIMSIRVLSSLSERLGLSDKFITDFIYPITQYKGEDMTANRLKFIVFTILSLNK